MKFPKIKRTLPPAASPIYLRDILWGIRGMIMGDREVERFRDELKETFGSRYCGLVSSGKVALAVTLETLRELCPERDQVVIPAFTCYSVPAVITRLGLRVRLCDVDPDTLDFDYDQLAGILSGVGGEESAEAGGKTGTEGILCVLPTHLFGIPSDISRVRKLVKDPGITVVEDAAQAMGGVHGGRKLGTLGDVGFFSLGRGKAFSTVEGGILLTDREDIGEIVERRIRMMPDYGTVGQLKLLAQAFTISIFLRPSLFWFPKSLPFLNLGKTVFETDYKVGKLSPFQAGLAIKWKARLREFAGARVRNAGHWASLFNQHMPGDHPETLNLIRFPVRLENREVKAMILSLDLSSEFGIMATYPDSIDGIEELAQMGAERRFPAAKKCSEDIITLPVHSYMSRRDRAEIESLFKNVIPSG